MGIQAIDTMFRAFYAEPELAHCSRCGNSTFAGVMIHHDIPEDEVWRVFEVLGNDALEETVDEFEE